MKKLDILSMCKMRACNPPPARRRCTAAGAYEVFGSYTFTASDAVGDEGRTCRILGYTLQEWNGRTLGAAEEHAGASYEYVVGTSPAKVLLTWRWQSAGTMVIFR